MSIPFTQESFLCKLVNLGGKSAQIFSHLLPHVVSDKQSSFALIDFKTNANMYSKRNITKSLA